MFQKTINVSLLIFGVFSINAHALVLNCNFQIVDWSVVGRTYTCTGSFQTVGDVRNVTDVTGNHTDGLTNINVGAIAVSSQLLLSGIPRNIEEFFPNLLILNFAYTNIPRISREDLAPFPQLRNLILFQNRIESLDSDLFVSNPSIQYINLSQNRLRHLGPNIFNSLNNLMTLRLQNNVCINTYVDNNITEIEKLRWEANFKCPPSIAQIEDQVFGGERFTNIVNQFNAKIAELEGRLNDLEQIG